MENVSHPNWGTFAITTNISHPYWETFPIPNGKCLPSLLGNVSLPYWEMFAIPTGKCFPSILGNISLPAGKRFPSLLVKVPNLSWERFPIWTGKHIPYSGQPFSPIWLRNIYPSQWEIFPNSTGKCFPFSMFNMAILSFFCNSRQTAWILQRINSSQNGSKRETFPGWLSTNYEKYSPLLTEPRTLWKVK